MDFRKGNINGVIVRKISRFTDKRGWLSEFWRDDEMRNFLRPAMGYISMTLPGVTRGPHEHLKQTDCFFFQGASTFRVMLWDNRNDSETFGNLMDFDAKENEPALVIIPPGIVHAYSNVGKGHGLVINLPDRLYAGENKAEKVDEVRYENDPESPFKVG